MKCRYRRYLIFFALSFIFILISCGSSDSAFSPSPDKDSGSGSRSSTPIVPAPSAEGSVTYGNDTVTIDASNSTEGYVMVNYTGSNKNPKLQLTGTDNVTYTYSLHGGYETLPLTSSSGSYKLVIYENLSGNQYSTAFTQSLDVTVSNEFGPYLYPNQYVNFTSDMNVIAQSQKLAENTSEDLDVVSNVYNYMISNFEYDYDKADHVPKGYLPVIDDILAKKKGICLDYASVMAAMLRVQNIPTRLEVGYCEDVYHAWVSIYLKNHGWVNGIIQFDGKDWQLMDPTFASTSKEPEEFITDNDLYTIKYVY